MQTTELIQAETAALNEVNDRLQVLLKDARIRHQETEIELHHLMFSIWYLENFKQEPVRDGQGIYQPFWDQLRFEAFSGSLEMMKSLLND